MAEMLVESTRNDANLQWATRDFLNARLSSFGIAALYCFLLFENPLEQFAPTLSYHDEFLFAAITILALMKLSRGYGGSNRVILPIIIMLLAVVCIGIVGTSLSGYQPSIEAVERDVLAFVKFPITLVAVLYLCDGWDSREALDICSFISKIFIVVCFVLSIINLFFPTEAMSHDVRQGIASFKFVFSHPTFLVLSLVLAFSIVAQRNSRIDAIKVMCLVALALTMRDKAFGFIGLVVALWCFRIQGKRRLFPYLLLAAVVVLVVAWPKIDLYLSWSNSPREAMYAGALQFAYQFFPFGSGFGTFASSLSGEYYSSAYYVLGISDMEGLRPSAFEAAGDNGIAYYFGQFGVLGSVLCIVIIARMCQYLLSRVNQESAARFSLIALLGYLAIALTVESTLTNASGVSVAIVLALITSGEERYAKASALKQSQREQ